MKKKKKKKKKKKEEEEEEEEGKEDMRTDVLHNEVSVVKSYIGTKVNGFGK